MAVVKTKPTSPGRRFVVKVVNPDLHKGKPHRALVKGLKKTGGRNSYGRITTRHHGGGHKRRYRIIDFKRHDKDGIQARVIRLEYDPNRSGDIALLRYIDGEYRYILAPRGLAVNDKVVSGSQAPIKVGNCLPIANIPVGTVVCAVELRPGKGAQLARSAGSSVQIVAKEGRYAFIKLQSGELRRVLLTCRACIGVMSNSEHNLRKLGKAGAKRWRGIRPTVRGVAMNPVDHPHGGGEGKTSGGRHPVSPWGVQTKGKRTRCNKRTDNDIIRRRKKKK